MKNILNINFDSKMNWDRLDAEKTQPKEIEIMDSAASVDTDLEILREQFKAYVDQLKKEWLQNNRSKSQDVFEVMNPTDRHEVERIIKQWSKYIEPLAEAC